MKISMDVTYLQDQFATRGIGRYTREIANRFLQQALIDDFELHLIGLGNFEDNFAKNRFKNIHWHKIGEPGVRGGGRNLVDFYTKLRPLVHKIRPSVHYAPYFEKGIPISAAPVIITVHDAIPITTGIYSQKSALHNWIKGIIYRSLWHKQHLAAKLIAVSKTSQQELIQLGFDPNKIEVVYNGIAKEFFANENDHVEQNNKINNIPFLLYDSGLEANKNVISLLKIVAELKKLGLKMNIVITGSNFKNDGRPRTEEAKKLCKTAQKLGIRNQVKPTGRVTDARLIRLFKQAAAYINLSNYEGFGFGPLQAMAAGTVAIVSDNPCFIEVSGSAALVVNAQDISRSAIKIKELLQNKARMQQMIKNGRMHARQFDWDKTFSKIYENCIHYSQVSSI